jgi:hypothetical protein
MATFRLTPAAVRAVRFVALGVALALLTVTACLVVPMRAQGADTVPGRFGAVALACKGTLDLREIGWIAAMAEADRLDYYARRTPQGAVVSTFGPAPAVLGALAMLLLEPGEVVTSLDLQKRARVAAAGALALAAALLFVALAALTGPVRAFLGAATAVLSFAGCATLGQGLWQQTALLPLLVGALATLAWGRRWPWVLAGTPALLAAAALVRLPASALVLGLAVAWLLEARQAPRRALLVAVSLPLAALGATPFLLDNLEASGSLLPLGQLAANAAMAPGGEAIVLSPGHLLTALGGLLASPARGLVFFAPVLLVALVVAWRAGDRLARTVALGIGLQVLFAAAFFKWWGGWSFGPRLLAEAVWVGVFLGFAFARLELRPVRLLVATTAAWTVLVGTLGLARYDLRLWEYRRNPDRNPVALWDFEDSPLVALVTREPGSPEVYDAPPAVFRYCTGRALSALGPRTTRGSGER